MLLKWSVNRVIDLESHMRLDIALAIPVLSDENILIDKSAGESRKVTKCSNLSNF